MATSEMKALKRKKNHIDNICTSTLEYSLRNQYKGRNTTKYYRLAR